MVPVVAVRPFSNAFHHLHHLTSYHLLFRPLESSQTVPLHHNLDVFALSVLDIAVQCYTCGFQLEQISLLERN